MNSKSIKETTEKSIAMLIDNYFKENYKRIHFIYRKDVMKELDISTQYQYEKYMMIYTRYFNLPSPPYQKFQKENPRCKT